MFGFPFLCYSDPDIDMTILTPPYIGITIQFIVVKWGYYVGRNLSCLCGLSVS